jgi:copper chaperone
MRRRSIASGVAVLSVVILAWGCAGQARQDRAEPRASETKRVILKVEGMTCVGCSAAVSRAAKTVPGVTGAEADHRAGRAEVTYDPSVTTPAAIAEGITVNSGFRASVPETDSER